MNRLDKKQSAQRDALVVRLNTAGEAVTLAVAEFNDAMISAWQKVSDAISEYNAAVDDANMFRDDVHSEMDGYYSGRSEKWQEGDNGSAYSGWMDEWGNELETLDIDEPDQVEAPDLQAANDLEELPSEPS